MANTDKNSNGSVINYQTVVSLIVGLVVGFGVGWYWYRTPSSQLALENAEQTTGEDETVSLVEEGGSTSQLASPTGVTIGSAENMVRVSDQPAGQIVVLSGLTANRSVWAAVRDVQGNELGRILGARRFDAGTYPSGQITLLRATETGKNYAVVLYADNGDGVFDHLVDTLVVKNGKPIRVNFRVL